MPSGEPGATLGRHWLTTALVALALAFYPATWGLMDNEPSWLFLQMTFTPVELAGNDYWIHSLQAVAARGEWWRLLSPMFLHFGWMHLAFNLLWVWVLGQRLEAVHGRRWLLPAVLFSSLAANLLQYLMTGPGLYGGLSGVVFGLFGHAFVFSRLNPEQDLGLPIGLYIFMLAFLLLGFTGLIDLLLPAGSLANGAHLGGLLAGLATGALAGLHHRLR